MGNMVGDEWAGDVEMQMRQGRISDDASALDAVDVGLTLRDQGDEALDLGRLGS